MSQDKIVQELVDKTYKELSRPPSPILTSREWKDPEGYQLLAVWQNASLLRVLIRKFTETLPSREFRLKSQLDDAARSQKRNIEEGWKRPTTIEYLNFLGYSQASLEEVKGDIRDARTDGFLISKPGSTLQDLGIDLRVVKGIEVKGEPTDLNHPYSKPLSTLNPKNLTFEMFMELINKTDWLLRKLVESLEKKLSMEQKSYLIERARIKGKLNDR
ncbi:MAG: four helix bundle protein [bacterium]|nr:four helix bundle protein [bacterium]